MLGDEPAGLWLLRRLHALGAASPEPPRLAWVSLKAERPPVALPRLVARPYEIAETDVWHPEIVTPHRSLPWTKETLHQLFPELPQPDAEPDPMRALLQPRASLLAGARYAIRHRPELLSFASGIWKILGRSHRLQPESLVLGSLVASELFWWNASDDLPSTIARYEVTAMPGALEQLKPRGDGLALHFRDLPALFGAKWILNLSLREAAAISTINSDLLKLLSLQGEMRASHALYPLRLHVEAEGIPCPVRPLTLYFDTEAIPDPQTEIWPIVLRAPERKVKELELWVDASRETSLEATLQSMREGMRRMNRLFPFLSRTLVDLDLPLEMDTCFTEQARIDALLHLEERQRELYDLTSFQTQTRHPCLLALFPFLNCHLPYPLGPLQVAQKLLRELLGKKKLQQAAQPPPPAPPT